MHHRVEIQTRWFRRSPCPRCLSRKWPAVTMRGLEVSIHTTWQRLVHSVPRGERIAAAVTFRNVQIGDCTAPWPGDTALPGTRALAVRCHVVNASIGIFVSLRVLSSTSNGVKSIKETLNVSNQNTIRACSCKGKSNISMLRTAMRSRSPCCVHERRFA